MISDETLLKALSEAEAGDYLLDQMFWSARRKVEFPLTSYDLETWEQCLREGTPEATLTTNLEMATTYAQKALLPEARLSLEVSEKRVSAEITILHRGFRIFCSNHRRPAPGKKAQASTLPIVFATALADALGRCRDLRKTIATIEDAIEQVEPASTWPIEQLPSGRFAAVDHKNRLVADPMLSFKKAQEYATITRRDPPALLKLRERYIKEFPDRT